MPRRRHQAWNHIKPSPQPDHFKPSPTCLAPSEPLHQPSVNALLSQLRSSQSTHNDYDTLSPRSILPVAAPSVPPSLQHLLGTPLPLPPPPRPRVGGPTARNRLAPGPRPPASWLHHSTAPTAAEAETSSDASRILLPDLPLPATNSLIHSSLLYLIKNWDFHQTYDQYYLPLLPPRLKSLILVYLARYSHLTPAAFSLLFSDGTEEVTHLDLPHANIAALLPVFRPPTPEEPVPEPESWDVAPASAVRFGALTHLSLAAPRKQDLKVLLQLLELTPGITHLSLAGWEALANPGAVRAVAKKSLCLKWLDVRGCSGDVLEMIGRNGAWTKEWRGVRSVVVSKRVVEPELDLVIGVGWLKDAVREVRRNEGLGTWLEVVSK